MNKFLNILFNVVFFVFLLSLLLFFGFAFMSDGYLIFCIFITLAFFLSLYLMKYVKNNYSLKKLISIILILSLLYISLLCYYISNIPLQNDIFIFFVRYLIIIISLYFFLKSLKNRKKSYECILSIVLILTLIINIFRPFVDVLFITDYNNIVELQLYYSYMLFNQNMNLIVIFALILSIVDFINKKV